jgi:DNA processing protein
VTPEDAYAAALCNLAGIGPATLVSMLRRWSPAQAWERVLSGAIERPPRGRSPSLAGASPDQLELAVAGRAVALRSGRTWAAAAASVSPEAWWSPMAARGIGVTWIGADNYPSALVDDPHPPGVLFWRGSLEPLRRPCVAIVGTRNATPDGRATAFEMGRDLAAAGVCVVSGLALGIDGAAHTGSLRSEAEPGWCPPVGVAASGVDVPYPRRNLQLWERVATCGAVVSETPPGRRAEAWRFPARNRVIAGLVRLVVVVESHATGGSLITAEAALERGVEVRVVPGPVHSPASAGSNQLLYDGPGPVRGARDVLDAIGLIRPDPAADRAAGRARAAEGLGGASQSSASPEPARIAALAALGWRPATLGQVVERSGLAISTAARTLDELAGEGVVGCDRGWWLRRPVP